MLIDRQERRAYLTAAADGRAFVRGQWPAEEVVELTPEEWDAVVERVRQAMLDRPLPATGELLRQMKEHSALVADMIRWLERWQAGCRE